MFTKFVKTTVALSLVASMAQAQAKIESGKFDIDSMHAGIQAFIDRPPYECLGHPVQG